MKYFTDKQLTQVRKRPVPEHIAIIMDGNRRWAQKNVFKSLKGPLSGHWKGADTLTTLVEAADELGVNTLTVFAFSTENWSRSEKEVATLIEIFKTYLREQRPRMIKENVRFQTIGDPSVFPQSLKDEVAQTVEATCSCSGINFVVAMNYGGRDEIRRVCHSLVQEGLAGKLKADEISEELIASKLDTAAFRDPDLLIRTSGEQRVSNFLLWQHAYSELYMTDVLWPDFTPRELLSAVLDFQKRKRRMGK